MALSLVWFGRSSSALVVYCSHDAIYSEKILQQFEQDTGIKVVIRFDTESTKSLGLTELLIREKEHPRCDVFWNNEILGTLDLAQQGLLEPYKGSGYDRIPDAFKDPQGQWVGFGARLRVWIINTQKMSATPEAVAQKLALPSLKHLTLAKPLYGTTRTHYTTLWHLWGKDKLIQWHRQWRQRGLIEAQSNGQTKNLVAHGHNDLGWTDTDDFFLAREAGQPVDMLPVRLDNNQTICIPNTVMIIKGTRKLAQAQKLVDYLTSEACELALSRSQAKQIPLGPVDESQLSDDVKQLKIWAKDGYPLGQLESVRQACLDWLKQEYLQ